MSDDTLTPEALAELERALADLSPPIGAVASDLNGYDLEQMSLPRLNDVAAILNAAPALIAANARVAELEEQVKALAVRATEFWDALNIANHQRDAATARADAAELRIAELKDRITEIADDALGLQSVDTPLLVMLGSLSKAIHEERIAKSAAERKVGDLVDLVEDRLNYIDDRHVVKELREALAAALPTKGFV